MVGHSLTADYSSIERTTRTGFLVSCSYKGTDCNDQKYWTMFTTPTYGNCFIFNSGMDPLNSVRSVTVTGSQNGLTLELFLDQKNYMLNKLSRKAGARITINDP